MVAARGTPVVCRRGSPHTRRLRRLEGRRVARRQIDEEKLARRAGWRLIFRLLLAHKGWLAFGVGAGLVWTGVRVAIPLLTAGAVDNGIMTGDTATALTYAAVIVAVGVVQVIATGSRRYGAFWLAYRTEAELRARLFAHFQRLHFAFHDEAQTGDLMARTNTDILQINQTITMLPFSMAAITTMIAVSIVMLIQSWSLALLALGALPFLNVAATRFATRVGPISTQLQGRLGVLTTVVEESVAGVRAAKGFGAEQEQHERLEVGQLVAYNLFIMMMIQPIRVVGQLVAQAARAVAAATRIDESLQADPQI